MKFFYLVVIVVTSLVSVALVVAKWSDHERNVLVDSGAFCESHAASCSFDFQAKSNKMTSEALPESMSIAEAKKELKEKYGVTDFSDVIEKDDLIKKLKEARKKPLPKKSALSYGRTELIGNTKNPTALMTLTHGLGDTSEGWADAARMLSSRHPHILFVLPTAPTQKVTMNMGMSMPSWYDIYDLRPGGKEDDDGVMTSAGYVQQLVVAQCDKFKIPTERVVFGGFSQGAVVSLAAGLTAPFHAAGILMMSGYLGGRQKVVPAIKYTDIPLLMCHGTADPLLPLPVAQMTHTFLTETAKLKQVEFKQYEGMEHSACPQELTDVSTWLKKVLP